MKQANRDIGKSKVRKMSPKRRLFDELAAGIRELRGHREGKLTLRTYSVEHASMPDIDPGVIKEIRERLDMSQAVFAQRLRVNPRTLQRWERGQSRPNDQAVALLLLVDRFPDTLDRLDEAAAAR